MNGMNNGNNNVYGPSNNLSNGGFNQNSYNGMNNMSNMVNNVANGNNMNNQPKKKGKTFLIVFLIVILMAVCLFGGWKLGTMYDVSSNDVKNVDKEEETKKEENADKEDKVEEIIPEKSSDYTFYKEEKVDYSLKEGKISVLYYYYVDQENLKNSSEEPVTKFIIRREAFVNGKSFTGMLIVGYTDEKTSVDSYISNDLKSANSSFVADTENDDSYLVLSLGDNKNLVYDGIFVQHDTYNVNAYLVNKNGDLLKRITVIDAGSSLIAIFINKNEVGDRKTYSKSEYKDKGIEVADNKAVIYFDNNVLDIHENFIYYVAADDGLIKNLEYKLTINNGVLAEKLIKTYSRDDIDAAGAE